MFRVHHDAFTLCISQRARVSRRALELSGTSRWLLVIGAIVDVQFETRIRHLSLILLKSGTSAASSNLQGRRSPWPLGSLFLPSQISRFVFPQGSRVDVKQESATTTNPHQSSKSWCSPHSSGNPIQTKVRLQTYIPARVANL